MALADDYASQNRRSGEGRLTNAVRQALEAELEKVCADAAAYHTLRAELDKQMEAKT